MKPIRTCILVADGAHARVYLNDGPGHGIEELPEYAQTVDLKPSREIDADKPGRTFDRTGEGRHAKESPTDAHRNAKQAFARAVSERIKAAFDAGKFDRLVLVAAPATLGDLRQALTGALGDKLHGEIAKDMTHASRDKLLKQLGTVLAV